MNKKLLILTAGLAVAAAGRGQFLKNLKDKVNNAVSGGHGGSASSGSPAAPGSSGNASNTAPVIDFAKYGITTSPAYTPADIKEGQADFEPRFTVYKIVDGMPAADVCIFATAQRHGEGWSYGAGDAAYIFEGGKLLRKAPVPDVLNDASIKAGYALRDWQYCYVPADAMKEFWHQNPDHTAVFRFNGKDYADFYQISTFFVNRDKTKMYAVGMKMEGGAINYYFFSSDGRSVKLPGSALNLLVNYDFSMAAVCGFIDPAHRGEVYYIDGRMMKTGGMSRTGWVDPFGRNVLFAQPNNGNYVDGVKIAGSGADPGNLWCSADGGKWAYYGAPDGGGGDGGGKHLVFSDGADIPNAQHPQQVVAGGKSYIVWVQTRALYGGDLLVCVKEL
ncbi:MAG TPA: hypothetical protein VL978_18620 [Puia sp.]|nr:hypothetical protein [Puia sp.]